ERSPEALLAAVAAGRTAIARAPAPATPTLLRLEDDLVAVDADGTVLGDVEGRRRVVHGDRVTIPAARAGTGPFRLEGWNGGLLAISA
ncbi:MAG: PHP domain-containing protein, partial [Candidatus Dormibacteraceae bacterium]